MLYYLMKRIALAVVIVVVAVILLYTLIQLVPGDPASTILGPRATAEMKEALRQRMGLDQPLIIQIGRFLGRLTRGDLGMDYFSELPVSELVFGQLGHTLVLVFASMFWAILLGIPLGCYSALFRNSVLDKITGVVSIGVIAMPSFVVALYALLVFAVLLHWLPAIGAGEAGNPASQLRHLILPAFAIGLGWVGYIARLVRASMLETMGENHIRTARAFGLKESTIVYRYAMSLAILPTITMLGTGIGRLISSAVFAEIVFARPGIGKLIYDSVISRNYPIVMGSVVVATALFVLATTVSDIVNAMLDPRIRESL
ncbi:MAG: ABC transporter permease [Desulfobacterales bacterium]|jgi:peptide/nickel transport system permease protein